MKSIAKLAKWAAERAGACDCAGGCYCHANRLRALNDYRTGLQAAWDATYSATVEDLLTVADAAIAQELATRGKGGE